MKKFSFLSAAVLLSSVVVVLLISCQKEQSAVSNEPEMSATKKQYRSSFRKWTVFRIYKTFICVITSSQLCKEIWQR
jgi:hypothetical protein